MRQKKAPTEALSTASWPSHMLDARLPVGLNWAPWFSFLPEGLARHLATCTFVMLLIIPRVVPPPCSLSVALASGATHFWALRLLTGTVKVGTYSHMGVQGGNMYLSLEHMFLPTPHFLQPAAISTNSDPDSGRRGDELAVSLP